MKTVALYLAPNFSLFHFSVPQMVFSTQVDKPLFDLKIVAEMPTVKLSDGITVQADGGLELFERADIVIVPAWNDYAEQPSFALQTALQQANGCGVMMVGLCLGAYALAYSGLLNGKKAATHWAAESDFSRRFPQVQLDSNALYVQDGNVMTSAGTAAGLDCCLAIVREIYGVQTANHLARFFVTPPHREGGQAQFIEQPVPRKTFDENINELLDDIRKNLQAVYLIDDIADRLSMSRSTFTRHFRKATGQSFARWLIETRLQRGRELLESSKLPVEQIAEQSGFRSAVSFRQHFIEKHKISPRAYRKAFGD
ncbi:AraC family transcriptional regulator [Actinobacillus succinogenes]|uniref:Transcriptional regulator, AraC family n=1 Tax=Actinobacillus succinogenes (strain ATCC 55618 / DSM 22257 / CCUG 43843 / 130Z) TaxID=339671 RepID=A6VKE7_ACTSZ|nr:helix-turn-helix domain-containing protein [Actinobacillus succinogenes]ABR73444.1 transcriptional regulator, AraC family [Actinobacillus succinogenes 130Z]PHI41225.1 AraC family transcriptional regulator [Actinobacillus succinogenes]